MRFQRTVEVGGGGAPVNQEVRAGDESRPEIQALMKALKSDEVKQFINDKYKGAVVPAF